MVFSRALFHYRFALPHVGGRSLLAIQPKRVWLFFQPYSVLCVDVIRLERLVCGSKRCCVFQDLRVARRLEDERPRRE